MEPMETDGSNFREEYDDEDPRMTDLVRLTAVSNPAEGAFLSALLDDADIPSVLYGATTGAMFGATEGLTAWLMVPSSMLDQAKRVLAHAKEEIEKKSIDEAFQAPNSDGDEAPEPEYDSELAECKALAGLPEDQRSIKLQKLLQRWSSRGDASFLVAQRLSAAGLTREQADEFIKGFASSPSALSESRSLRFKIAGLLFLTEIVLLALGWHSNWVLVAACFFAAWGFAIQPPKWHVQTPAPPKDDAPQP
ncbi:MAG: DUF2007 domain-containing protein [Planctomycetes bacterium]|nr:DUF2007 domain-containing protein [Planctomycetota bacterium]